MPSLQLNDEFSDQVLAIEQKFSLKRKPLYAERNLSLSAIPQFWLSTLQKHPSIHQVLDAEDIEILKYCYEVVVEDNEDIKTGYKIRFKFSENPYFVDEELVKTIAFCEGSQMYISSSLPQVSYGPTVGPHFHTTDPLLTLAVE